MLRFLLAGETLVRSAPLLTIQRCLERHGHSATPSAGRERGDIRAWLRHAREHDAVVGVFYDGPPSSVARRLGAAVAVGVPVIRVWVGTDVLNCLTDQTRARDALTVARVASASIACAPHLATELRSIGMEAEMYPSLTDPPRVPARENVGSLAPGVVVYLPDRRLDFYRKPDVEELARRHADLQFLVVGDNSHSLAHLPNVVSYGWVDDMESVYRQAGCVLRLTRHDGFPRMLADAISRQLYAIYSWDFPGAWTASTVDEADRCLQRFKQCRQPNREGRLQFEAFVGPSVEQRWVERLQEAAGDRGLRRRWRGLGVWIGR